MAEISTLTIGIELGQSTQRLVELQKALLKTGETSEALESKINSLEKTLKGSSSSLAQQIEQLKASAGGYSEVVKHLANSELVALNRSMSSVSRAMKSIGSQPFDFSRHINAIQELNQAINQFSTKELVSLNSAMRSFNRTLISMGDQKLDLSKQIETLRIFNSLITQTAGADLAALSKGIKAFNNNSQGQGAASPYNRPANFDNILARGTMYAMVGGTAYSEIAAVKAAINGVKDTITESNNAWVEYQSKMLQIKVLSGATATELNTLGDSIKSIASSSYRTINDVQEASIVLSQAGKTVAEQQQMLPAVLDLARAGGISLEKAADIVVTTLNQFGLKASDSKMIVDQFAKGAAAASQDVNQLAKALARSGNTANTFKSNLSDTILFTTALTELGVKSERAAQATNAFYERLERLSQPTKRQADSLKALGLTAEQLSPSTNSLVQIIDRLHDASNRSYTDVSNLFGSLAAPKLSGVIERGGAYLDELRKKIEGSATAAEQAAAKLPEGQKAILGYQTALESLKLSIGSADSKPMQDLYKELTNLVKTLNSPETIGAMRDVFVPLISGTEKAIKGISGIIDAMKLASDVFLIMKGAFGGVSIGNTKTPTQPQLPQDPNTKYQQYQPGYLQKTPDLFPETYRSSVSDELMRFTKTQTDSLKKGEDAIVAQQAAERKRLEAADRLRKIIESNATSIEKLENGNFQAQLKKLELEHQHTIDLINRTNATAFKDNKTTKFKTLQQENRAYQGEREQLINQYAVPVDPTGRLQQIQSIHNFTLGLITDTGAMQRDISSKRIEQLHIEMTILNDLAKAEENRRAGIGPTLRMLEDLGNFKFTESQTTQFFNAKEQNQFNSVAGFIGQTGPNGQRAGNIMQATAAGGPLAGIAELVMSNKKVQEAFERAIGKLIAPLDKMIDPLASLIDTASALGDVANSLSGMNIILKALQDIAQSIGQVANGLQNEIGKAGQGLVDTGKSTGGTFGNILKGVGGGFATGDQAKKDAQAFNKQIYSSLEQLYMGMLDDASQKRAQIIGDYDNRINQIKKQKGISGQREENLKASTRAMEAVALANAGFYDEAEKQLNEILAKGQQYQLTVDDARKKIEQLNSGKIDLVNKYANEQSGAAWMTDFQSQFNELTKSFAQQRETLKGVTGAARDAALANLAQAEAAQKQKLAWQQISPIVEDNNKLLATAGMSDYQKQLFEISEKYKTQRSTLEDVARTQGTLNTLYNSQVYTSNLLAESIERETLAKQKQLDVLNQTESMKLGIAGSLSKLGVLDRGSAAANLTSSSSFSFNALDTGISQSKDELLKTITGFKDSIGSGFSGLFNQDLNSTLSERFSVQKILDDVLGKGNLSQKIPESAFNIIQQSISSLTELINSRIKITNDSIQTDVSKIDTSTFKDQTAASKYTTFETGRIIEQQRQGLLADIASMSSVTEELLKKQVTDLNSSFNQIKLEGFTSDLGDVGNAIYQVQKKFSDMASSSVLSSEEIVRANEIKTKQIRDAVTKIFDPFYTSMKSFSTAILSYQDELSGVSKIKSYTEISGNIADLGKQWEAFSNVLDPKELSDRTNSLNSIFDTIKKTTDYQKQSVETLKSSYEGVLGLGKSIRDQLNNIQYGQLSTDTSLEKYNKAKAQYDSLKQLALNAANTLTTADDSVISEFVSFSQTFLQASQEQFGASSINIQDFKDVTSTLNSFYGSVSSSGLEYAKQIDAMANNSSVNTVLEQLKTLSSTLTDTVDSGIQKLINVSIGLTGDKLSTVGGVATWKDATDVALDVTKTLNDVKTPFSNPIKPLTFDAPLEAKGNGELLTAGETTYLKKYTSDFPIEAKGNGKLLEAGKTTYLDQYTADFPVVATVSPTVNGTSVTMKGLNGTTAVDITATANMNSGLSRLESVILYASSMNAYEISRTLTETSYLTGQSYLWDSEYLSRKKTKEQLLESYAKTASATLDEIYAYQDKLGNLPAFQQVLESAPIYGSGGMISGRSHSRGGVMINAEGGEYVIQKSAVNSLGTGFLDSINSGSFTPQTVFVGGGSSNGEVVALLRELIAKLEDKDLSINVDVDPTKLVDYKISTNNKTVSNKLDRSNLNEVSKAFN